MFHIPLLTPDWPKQEEWLHLTLRKRKSTIFHVPGTKGNWMLVRGWNAHGSPWNTARVKGIDRVAGNIFLCDRSKMYGHKLRFLKRYLLFLFNSLSRKPRFISCRSKTYHLGGTLSHLFFSFYRWYLKLNSVTFLWLKIFSLLSLQGLRCRKTLVGKEQP